MTTITIDDTMIGLTIARAGATSKLAITSAGNGVGGASFNQTLTLVDDAPPFDTVPKTLFNSDMLAQAVGGDTRGVCFQNQSIAFGNLTIKSVPSNAVFSIEATGAVALDELEAQRAELARRTAMPRALPYVPARTSTELTPHAAPAAPLVPPNKALIAADAEGARIIAAEHAARATAKGPTIVGEPLMAVQDQLRAAAQRQRQGARS
jgi:hypothetical protein